MVAMKPGGDIFLEECSSSSRDDSSPSVLIGLVNRLNCDDPSLGSLGHSTIYANELGRPEPSCLTNDQFVDLNNPNKTGCLITDIIMATIIDTDN